MSLDKCIPDLVKKGELTKEQGERAKAIYGKLQVNYRRTMGSAAADALASQDAVEALARENAQIKRQKLLQVAAQKDAIAKMAGFDKGSGKRPAAAAAALFARDERATYPNVEYRWRFHVAEAHAEISALLEHHSRNALTVLPDKAGLQDLLREAFGEDSGNQAAKQYNEAWQSAAETLRQKFNAAGGAIGKIDHWGLPQSHDSLAVAEAAKGTPEWQALQAELEATPGDGRERVLRKIGDLHFKAWLAASKPLLDRAKMIDETTGKPFDDASLDNAMLNAWVNISTDGWGFRIPGGQVGSAKLANARAEHRFLIFDGSDNWLKYQERFGGNGTVFDTINGHVNGMARDIAMMEILGPNPSATLKWLQDGLEKGAALLPDQKARDRAYAGSRQLQRLYDEVMGANSRPESRAIALVASGIRSFEVSTKLGSSVISALGGDPVNGAMTRAYNGLPVTKMVGSYLRFLKPGAAEDRAIAMRSGLTADDLAAHINGDNRLTGLEMTGEVSKRMAEATLRLSGLNALTRAGRWAFGMDMISQLTNESVKGYDALDGRYRSMLQRYGIGAGDWDAIRSTALEEEGGVPWLKPLSIERQDLRSRVIEMILSETDVAVPTPGLRMRASVNGVLPSGTVLGELGRLAFQFKGFGVSMMIDNWRRMMASDTIAGKIGYALAYTAFLTLGGLYAIQMREVAKGKDPRPLSDPNLWIQGTFQGGAFGPYGDFVNSAQSRFGGGVMDMLAGPVWSDANQIGKIAIGDAFAEARGQHTNRGREVTKLIEQMTPVIGSHWATRTAYDRLLEHQLQLWADPLAGEAWQRSEQRAYEQGQGFWWGPGQAAPSRAPDLGNALNGQTHYRHEGLLGLGG